MRTSESGKLVLPHSSQINCEPGDEGQAGRSWYVDETYVNVKGKWCSLYRAIDRDGNVVDSMLSEKRDMEAAKRFFKQAVEVVGHTPERVTTDGHDSYPRAIRETLGSDVIHRCNPYLNNRRTKTTVASSIATTPCVGLEASHQPPASAEPSMKCASSSGC